MPEFEITSPDGTKYRVTAPEGATEMQAMEKVRAEHARQPEQSRLGRLGTGFMDPIYGAAQMGARMEEEGSGIGAAIADIARPGAAAEFERDKATRIGQIDETVRKREADIQSRRAPNAGIDWYRAGGSIPSTMALSAPFMALSGLPGAIMGGGVGGVLQPVTEGNFGTEKVKQGAIGATLGGVIGGATKAAGAGVKALGSYIAREYPENIMTQAVQKVLKRLSQDEKAGGLTAQGAIDAINEASRTGKPMTLADVGGENVKALAGNVARQPGESRNVATQFLDRRDLGAAQRLQADIGRFVSDGNMRATTEGLLEARSAAGRPAYAAVHEMQGIWSPRLQQFLDDPVVRRGMARGYEIERLQSLAQNRPFNPTQLGVDLDAQGEIVMRGVPNMRVVDMGKQGLDAMIADERNEITGRLSSRGVALEQVRRAYLNEIDGLDQAGVYRNARAAWAGYSQSLDATRAGRTIFANSPDEIAAQLAQMAERSPGNLEFYRLGVADVLREKLAKAGLNGDEGKQLLKNQWVRDQLRPVFRSENDFNAFVKSVTDEIKMFDTRFQTIRGSQTAVRRAEDESAENMVSAEGAHLAGQVATGHFMSAAKTAVRLWRNAQDKRGNPKLNEQVARILFETPISETSEIGQRLTGKFPGEESINRLAGVARKVGRSGAPIAPAAGAAAGQPTSAGPVPGMDPLRAILSQMQARQ